MELYALTVCGAEAPLTAPVEGVRFGWKLRADRPGTLQTRYRLRLVREDGGVAYDSGDVFSDDCVDVRPDGLRLDGETDYLLTVEAESSFGEVASAESRFSTGLSADGWKGAKWIRPRVHLVSWAPYLRKKFIAAKPIRRAVLYACGLGIGEFWLNGQRVNDYLLDPPATNYDRSILYRATDVTALLREGGNALACLLGDGFYVQNRVWLDAGDMVYGKVCALARLRIEYADGTVGNVVTDTSWNAKYSPVSSNNVYGGEMYDCRLETPDFADFDGEEEGWDAVVEDTTPRGKLIGCLMPPVRVLREIPCIGVQCASGAADGAWVFDLGENFAGIYELRVPAGCPRGTVYTIRTAETVNDRGQLDFRSTGSYATQCIQQEIYITRGDGKEEIYRPRFAYHGFRYVEITGVHDLSEGYCKVPAPDMVVGLPLSTDLRETVRFSTAFPDLDRLYGIMKHTFRNNYHGYPEDCPAREKCGWLGDAQVVVDWGLLNYDLIPSYEKYLRDIRETVEVFGAWQMISPGRRTCGEASPLWGCAQVLLPYWMWRYRGDRSAVTDNHDLMTAWVEHEHNKVRGKDAYIIEDGLGDWNPPGGNQNPRRIPVRHSSTLMFYEICLRMAEIDVGFGYGDGAYYRDLAARIRTDFNAAFYDAAAHSYGYWATNGAALCLGIFPDDEHDALAAATAALIEADGYRMPTGIYGNKYLVPALLDNGLGDLATRFLFNRDYASFGTMMDEGGTTVWEELDMRLIQTDRSCGVASYDHPMHGGFLYACITKLAGIEPIEPGFRRFRVRPRHIAAVPQLDLTFDSPYGDIGVRFDRDGDGYRYEITVPANTQAVVELDGKTPCTVGSGVWHF